MNFKRSLKTDGLNLRETEKYNILLPVRIIELVLIGWCFSLEVFYPTGVNLLNKLIFCL